MSAAIEQTVQARIIAAPPAARDISVGLRYDTNDPVAVRVVFPSDAALEDEEASWALARELLDAGLRAPAGDGDVHVRPCGQDRTVIELRAQEGVALVEFSAGDLRRFLRHSYAVIPRGEEHLTLDLDGELATLLGGV